MDGLCEPRVELRLAASFPNGHFISHGYEFLVYTLVHKTVSSSTLLGAGDSTRVYPMIQCKPSTGQIVLRSEGSWGQSSKLSLGRRAPG